jgi:hypothetical protein
MIRTHFGAAKLTDIHHGTVLRYTDKMNPYFEQPTDTLFFLVKDEPNPGHTKVVTRTREVPNRKGGKKSVTEEFVTQIVRVFPFRWDPKKGVAIRQPGGSINKEFFFSTKDLEHPGLEEVEARVIQSDGNGIFALRVPKPKATPKVLAAQA